MQTSLPDLPFTNYGKAELDPFDTHSPAETTPPKYPRTNLKTLRPWASFPNEIDQAIRSAATNASLSSAPFTIDALKRTTIVKNEEAIRAHAIYALDCPVEDVLNKLGVTGSFHLSGGGNTAIVGSPDFTWIMSTARSHPKIIVRVPITTYISV